MLKLKLKVVWEIVSMNKSVEINVSGSTVANSKKIDKNHVEPWSA